MRPVDGADEHRSHRHDVHNASGRKMDGKDRSGVLGKYVEIFVDRLLYVQKQPSQPPRRAGERRVLETHRVDGVQHPGDMDRLAERAHHWRVEAVVILRGEPEHGDRWVGSQHRGELVATEQGGNGELFAFDPVGRESTLAIQVKHSGAHNKSTHQSRVASSTDCQTVKRLSA